MLHRSLTTARRALLHRRVRYSGLCASARGHLHPALCHSGPPLHLSVLQNAQSQHTCGFQDTWWPSMPPDHLLRQLFRRCLAPRGLTPSVQASTCSANHAQQQQFTSMCCITTTSELTSKNRTKNRHHDREAMQHRGRLGCASPPGWMMV